ncbi:histidine kinase [Paenibacillaceae bacterium WGS1546]|uniref:histidine kinase n=1 Tax=Cohnella sp. WGS1546 TaxID=3366810 RepID=UPI00372D40AE
MKLKVITAIAVFLALLGLRMSGLYGGGEESPRAAAGLIDLSDWRADATSVVPLRGEWSFLPATLLEPNGSSGSADAREWTIANVPGSWDRLVAPGERTPFGYGAYKLRLRLPEAAGTDYALRVQIVRTAHKLYVNGELMGQQGEPGRDAASTEPKVMPYTVLLGPMEGTVEIVVAAANFDYGSQGGMFEAIRVGSAAAIEREAKLGMVGNAILMGFYFIGGLSFLFLYLFRRKNVEMLFFSLFFWMSLVFWATHDDRLLFWLFPQIPYDWQTRLQLLPSLGLYWSLFRFVRAMWPEYGRRWAFRLIDGTMAAAVAVVLSTDASFFSRYELLLMAFDAVMFVYSIAILFAGNLKRGSGSSYALVGAVCILMESLVQASVYLGFTTDSPAFTLERVLFVVMMVLLVAQRLFSGVKQVELLSKNLLVADRLKNEFLVNVSQEMRVPLHGMINLAQTMTGEAGRNGNKPDERLKLLVASGRRLAHLLDDVLDLSKLNGDGIALRLRTVDVRMTINGALEVMSHMADNGKLVFENRSEPGVPYAYADEQRVLQILLNLLNYAIGVGATGKVEVAAEAEASGSEIGVVVRAPEGEWAVSAAEPEAEAGMEIGRKLIELHGGSFERRLSARSGLRLRFTLPVSEQQDRPLEPWSGDEGRELAASAEAAANVPDGAPKVLIAADDKGALKVMADLLAQEGFRVKTASDGRQGLKLWESESDWDLIVLEVMLPWLSGYEFCRIVRTRSSFYDLPVLFLTSRNQPADLLVGFNAGANDYVTLPIDGTEFRARVRTLLKMKQSLREQLHMEMALFQAQIKPHFLYNTLNTIASLSEIDPERTRELLNDFSSYLRSSFDLRNLDKRVSFSQEWTLVRSYLQIEQARFGNRIRVNVRLPESLSFELPPLTLQPIVENALRHGILRRFEGGQVEIAAEKEAAGYRVTVKDDGVGFPPGKIEAVLSGEYRSGIGLSNVDRRLKNAYGTGLTIRSEPGEGTEVGFLIAEPKEGLR